MYEHAMTAWQLVQDNDSHWYVIPFTCRAEWAAFCDIPEDDERGWDVPEWATRVDGPHVVVFGDWREER